MSKPVVVRIISDLVCPWCYVGRKNLEKAVLDSKVPGSKKTVRMFNSFKDLLYCVVSFSHYRMAAILS